MIRKIGIKNFRVFRDCTEFDIAPITLLTGPNNSGKSSLIKMLSLLKNSFNKLDRIEKLNFDGGNHNLGTFENVISTNGNSNHIKIRFNLPLNYFDEKFKIELSYKYGGKENGELFSIKIFNNNRILIWVLLNDDVFESVSNSYYCSIDIMYIKNTIDKILNIKEAELLFNYYKDERRTIQINEDFKGFFKTFETIFSKYHYEFDPASFPRNYFIFEDNIQKTLLPAPLSHYLNGFRKENNLAKNDYVEQILENIPSKGEYYDFINEVDEVYLRLNSSYLEHIDNYFYENITDSIQKLLYSINSIEHISAQRGSQQRILSDLGSNEINTIAREYFFNSDNAFLDKAMKVLGIKGELKIEREEGIISKIYLINGDSKVALADFGYGYSQIIPILLKIITVSVLKKNEWFNPYSIHDIEKEDKDYIAQLFKTRKKAFEIILQIISKANVDNSEEFLDALLNDLNRYNSIEYIEEYNTILNLLLNIPENYKDKIMKSHYADSSHEEYDLFVMMTFPKELYFDTSGIVESKTKNAVLIIEEPEANLHPNLQSKLADILVMAHQEFGVHFILETHSEYLIRKLQYLVAKKDISQDDVRIYYFNSDEFVTVDEKKVKEIKIDEFGGLTDTFGPGFFDEATQLQFELYKLNQAQSN